MRNVLHHHQEKKVILASLNSSFQLAGSYFPLPIESLSKTNTNVLFYSFDDTSGELP